ncbi:hypothetical protein UY3_00888 [Chelonia mydas]|uniref:Uncharacterized protein n=1 Tax=Chelonia mydas TaxID=8469 RepID=M7CAZ3_CHEMY|nr:hypothetical protein UY3_00888 [Chelonia mydas]
MACSGEEVERRSWTLSLVATSLPTAKSPVDTSEGMEVAERALNPKDEVIDEVVELDEDVQLPAGSPSGAGSHEPFSTPEVSSQSHQSLSREQEAGDEMPGTASQLRPNIIVADAEKNKVLMVDVMVLFENRSQAFHEARARKALKYTPLAETLRAQGYEVQIHALVVAALGPPDKLVLSACGAGRRYAQLMRQLMVSDTIRWSRDIYMEHITGHRQYEV